MINNDDMTSVLDLFMVTHPVSPAIDQSNPLVNINT